MKHIYFLSRTDRVFLGGELSFRKKKGFPQTRFPAQIFDLTKSVGRADLIAQRAINLARETEFLWTLPAGVVCSYVSILGDFESDGDSKSDFKGKLSSGGD